MDEPLKKISGQRLVQGVKNRSLSPSLSQEVIIRDRSIQ